MPIHIFLPYIGRGTTKQFRNGFEFIASKWKRQGCLYVFINEKFSLVIDNIMDPICVVSNNNSTISLILLLGFDFFTIQLNIVH